MRGLRSLLSILVVFLGLAAYVYFVESKRTPASEEEPKDKVFQVESDDIRELRITADNGDTTTLTKAGVGSAWQVVEPLEASADSTEVSGIVTNLASLEIQRVVEEASSTLDEYGLSEPRIEVAFKTQEGDDFSRLLLGEKTATGSDLYAKLATEERVFLVSGFLESTFNQSAFDLRDKAILELDSQTIDRLEIVTQDASVELTRSEGDWEMAHPWSARGDYGTIQGIVGRLTSAQMTSTVAGQADDLEPYGLTTPTATVTLGVGSSATTLAFGTTAESGGVYARDLSKPAVFTVDASLVDELQKDPAEYRNKDLFGFRPFNATRFEITRESETAIYEKVEAPAPSGDEAEAAEGEAAEVWRQTAPVTREIDADNMQTALSGMANLRALYFAGPDVQTGLDRPITTVVAHYDAGKVDRVTFGLDEEDVYAAIEGEPGAARVDTQDYNLAIKSLMELGDEQASDGLDPTDQD